MGKELRLYLIIRNDIEIPAGKAMAQAGHGFVMALEASRKECQDVVTEYLSGCQAKIVLQGTLHQIKRAQHELTSCGITNSLIVDAARTVFDKPTVTCLGFGPVKRNDLPKYVARLSLKGGE